jgi:hypothetical protein
MFTDYRPVDSTVLANIRQQMLALASTIQELEEILFGSFGCWEYWSDWYLFEVAIERYKAAQMLLNIFTNTPDPYSPTPDETQFRVYQFTMLIASLSRSNSVLGVPTDSTIEGYQKLVLPFNKFCFQVDKLHEDIGYFC